MIDLKKEEIDRIRDGNGSVGHGSLPVTIDS